MSDRTPVISAPPSGGMAACMSTLIERTRIDPAEVDDVIFGQCYPTGPAGPGCRRCWTPPCACRLETMCIGGGQGLAAIFERV